MSDQIEFLSLQKSDFKEIKVEYPKNGYAYIYHLIDENEEVIYVGQTKNLYARLSAHMQDKIFYKVVYREEPDDMINECEAADILEFLPKLNNSVPKNSWYLSLDDAVKINTLFYSKRVQILRYLHSSKIYSIHGYYFISDLLHALRFVEDKE